MTGAVVAALFCAGCGLLHRPVALEPVVVPDVVADVPVPAGEPRIPYEQRAPAPRDMRRLLAEWWGDDWEKSAAADAELRSCKPHRQETAVLMETALRHPVESSRTKARQLLSDAWPQIGPGMAVLVAALQDRDEAVRRRAVEFACLHAPADDRLTVRLARMARFDPSAELRLAVVRRLAPDFSGCTPPERAHPLPVARMLHAALSDPDEAVRLAAVGGLAVQNHREIPPEGRLPPDARDRLVRMMDELKPDMRVVAARVLAGVGGPDVLDVLLRLARDPDPAVASAAADGVWNPSLSLDAQITLFHASRKEPPDPFEDEAWHGGARTHISEMVADRRWRFGLHTDVPAGHVDDPESKSRREIAMALYTDDDARAVRLLRHGLTSPDPSHRAIALNAVDERHWGLESGALFVPPAELLPLLHAEVRRAETAEGWSAAMQTLDRVALDVEEVLPHLIVAAGSRDWERRREGLQRLHGGIEWFRRRPATLVPYLPELRDLRRREYDPGSARMLDDLIDQIRWGLEWQ